MNQLLAYEDGKLIYTGTKHEYEFVDSTSSSVLTPLIIVQNMSMNL